MPSQLEKLLIQSDTYFNKQDYERALEFAENAYQLNPKSTEIIIRLVDILFKQQRYKDVIAYLEDITDDVTEKPYREYLLGRAYYEIFDYRKELETAVYYLLSASRHFIKKGSDSNCMYFAGIANAILAQLDMEKNPEIALERYDAVIVLLKAALKINKFEASHHPINAHLYCAESYYYQGNYDESIQSLFSARKMLNDEICPNLEKEFQRLSKLLENAGYAKQIASIKQYAELKKELYAIRKARDKINNEICEIEEANKSDLAELGQEYHKILHNNPQKATQTQVSNHPNSLYRVPQRQSAQKITGNQNESQPKNECSMM